MPFEEVTSSENDRVSLNTKRLDREDYWYHEKLLELVEYLIDNIYVSISNRVYRQCVAFSQCIFRPFKYQF